MRNVVISAQATTMAACASLPALAQPILGSGSTFAHPIIARWSDGWLRSQSDGGDFVADERRIDYEPIGSLAGTMRLGQPDVDFAASDVPLPKADLDRLGLIQLPLVKGGIAIVTNLAGLPSGSLKLDGDLLARIHLGQVTSWSAPEVRLLNPDLALPDQKIVPAHRADGSGTTYNLTSFLSAASPEWKATHGADTLIAWPSGTSVKGTSAMVQTVRSTAGSIGYAELGQAAQAGLAVAAIRNSAGRFVVPSPSTLRAAAEEPDAYPLTATTYLLLRRKPSSTSRDRRIASFLEFALRQGAADAARLGYVPLSDAEVDLVLRQLSERSGQSG